MACHRIASQCTMISCRCNTNIMQFFVVLLALSSSLQMISSCRAERPVSLTDKTFDNVREAFNYPSMLILAHSSKDNTNNDNNVIQPKLFFDQSNDQNAIEEFDKLSNDSLLCDKDIMLVTVDVAKNRMLAARMGVPMNDTIFQHQGNPTSANLMRSYTLQVYPNQEMGEPLLFSSYGTFVNINLTALVLSGFVMGLLGCAIVVAKTNATSMAKLAHSTVGMSPTYAEEMKRAASTQGAGTGTNTHMSVQDLDKALFSLTSGSSMSRRSGNVLPVDNKKDAIDAASTASAAMVTALSAAKSAAAKVAEIKAAYEKALAAAVAKEAEANAAYEKAKLAADKATAKAAAAAVVDKEKPTVAAVEVQQPRQVQDWQSMDGNQLRKNAQELLQRGSDQQSVDEIEANECCHKARQHARELLQRVGNKDSLESEDQLSDHSTHQMCIMSSQDIITHAQDQSKVECCVEAATTTNFSNASMQSIDTSSIINNNCILLSLLVKVNPNIIEVEEPTKFEQPFTVPLSLDDISTYYADDRLPQLVFSP